MEFAQSANDALRLLSTAEALTLLLILSDVNMPEMSGIELLPKIKASRPHVPVIMITAYGDAATRERALANGAESLLTKPLDFSALRKEIELRMGMAA
jgi:CheY-like chemotaxis protein